MRFHLEMNWTINNELNSCYYLDNEHTHTHRNNQTLCYSLNCFINRPLGGWLNGINWLLLYRWLCVIHMSLTNIFGFRRRIHTTTRSLPLAIPSKSRDELKDQGMPNGWLRQSKATVELIRLMILAKYETFSFKLLSLIATMAILIFHPIGFSFILIPYSITSVDKMQHILHE